MGSQEPEFRAWRRRVCKASLILCGIAIPVGFAFVSSSPGTTLYVSGLGLLGCIISGVRLATLKKD